VRVLSLIGDLAKGDDGQASLHLHAVLGLQDGSCRGGHFLSGKVRPTLEVTIMETAMHLPSQEAGRFGHRPHRSLNAALRPKPGSAEVEGVFRSGAASRATSATR